MTMMRALATLLVLVCAGCQQAPPPVYDVPQSRTYGQSKTEVWDAILRFLKTNAITVAKADVDGGMIEAARSEFQDMSWADCQRARVVDNQSDSNRLDRGRPVSRDLTLQINVGSTADQTKVDLAVLFSERQINPFRNLPFTVDCRSKGQLERSLFAAI